MGAETTNEISDTFEIDREDLGYPRKKKKTETEDAETTVDAAQAPPRTDSPTTRDAAAS